MSKRPRYRRENPEELLRRAIQIIKEEIQDDYKRKDVYSTLIQLFEYDFCPDVVLLSLCRGVDVMFDIAYGELHKTIKES